MTTMLPAAALLAQVPEIHLRKGEWICAASGRLTPGSRACETLSRFDSAVDAGAPVLLYASQPTEYATRVVGRAPVKLSLSSGR